MLGSRIPGRLNVLTTAIGRENFGAIGKTLLTATIPNASDNSCDKENNSTGENPKKACGKEKVNFMPRGILKEKNGGEKDQLANPVNKAEIIKQMLKTEEHHVIELIEDEQGNMADVIWCPVYLRPESVGRARGADEIPHHRCKTCGWIGLHLLNDGQKYRPCLRCSGWSEAEIPAWYYHSTCCHCENTLKH
jgi:hypothetical protein